MEAIILADEPAPRIVYVNAYAVHRCYGGSEEGGWWYDAGEPLASVPVELLADAERERDRLRALLQAEHEHERQDDEHGRCRVCGAEPGDFENHRGIGSVLGGSELRIVFSSKPAAHWPRERPRYS